ncbi:hypothetical protein CMI37_02555 [Candidatus Pacearchaeota archaeon]|nr:hypothetical protein [Candidatus Pacearchaeota archaeon]
MGKDTKLAVGIKLYIGEHLIKDAAPNEFERYVKCEVSGVDIGWDNILHCKYYDDIDGFIYFHFEKPVKRSSLQVFFEEEEIINELKTKTE